MKNRNRFLSFCFPKLCILVFGLFTGIGTSLQAQVYNGSITFTSQSQIDNFTGYTSITGDVEIENNSITNVDSLYKITEIQGSLLFREAASLNNIDGFLGLTKVGGTLSTSPNGYLTSNGCNLLTNFNGFSNLTEVGGSLEIAKCSNLVDISALSNLTEVELALDINDNQSLTNLSGLQNIDSILIHIWISNNDNLQEVDSLKGLQFVGNYVFIQSNLALKNVTGFRNLIDVDSFFVFGNPQLEDCCGLFNYVNSVGLATASWTIDNNGAGCTAADILANGPCQVFTGHSLIGNSYFDLDGDCVEGTQDLPVKNLLIKASPGPYYALIDTFGDFQINVAPGTYTLSILSPQGWDICGPNPAHTVTPADSIVATGDIGLEVENCPDLTVNMSGMWNRRCFSGDLKIDYCNNGVTTATQTTLTVKVPEHLIIEGANAPYTANADTSELVFDLGSLAFNECGTIILGTKVSCSNIEILGLTQCFEAWLYSPDICPQTASSWSGASLFLEAECVNNNNTNRFTVINNGQGDMVDSTDYRIFADSLLVQTGKLLLNNGDSLAFDIPSNGQMFRVEVDQVPNHPSNVMVSAFLEGCVPTLLVTTSKGIATEFASPIPNPEPTYAAHCKEIIGSYDPNDKQVFPSGFFATGLTKPGTRLRYLIRFQNTGTDTAFNIVVVDTLSADLDVSTLKIEGSSHPYTLQVGGQGQAILNFHYNNILLPDSNVNEPKSHGFIQFSIDHNSTAPLGTEIENLADIYFDFNPAIRTNTVINTLSNYEPSALGSVANITTTYHPNLSNSLSELSKAKFQLYPNPAEDVINISFEDFYDRELLIEWIDINGRVVHQSTEKVPHASYSFQYPVPEVAKGLYLIRLNKRYSRKILIK